MRALAIFLLLAAPASAGEERRSPWSVPFGFSGSCSAASTVALPDLPSAYYGIDLVPTKRVPGTGAGVGIGVVTFARSPYGVSVTPDGTYVVDVDIALDRIKKPKRGVLTAWATKDDLTEVKRLGALDDAFRASGRVGWNKFLLVVTLEPPEPSARAQGERSESRSEKPRDARFRPSEETGTGSGTDKSATDIWKGPVVMRGMSRSGLMHTLAGHGPYEKEPCAKYGF
jgi:hypothetical protein